MNEKLLRIMQTIEEAERQIAEIKKYRDGANGEIDILEEAEAGLGAIKKCLNKLGADSPKES